METDVFQLTLEQEFQIKLIEQSTSNMSREQMQDLLLEVSRMIMVKDNVIRDLVKHQLFPSFA